ncbi:MAG: hypothetical protein WA687_12745 [Solirubrobacterales bacterium]
MGSKSDVAFPDDDAWRSLRNWVVHNPVADVGQLHHALAALGRTPSWRELAAALELFGKRAPSGAPPFLAGFVSQLAAARGAERLLDPFATSPTMIAALAECIPAAQAVALTPNEWVEQSGRSVAPGVEWQVGVPSETLLSLDGQFDFVAATPPLGVRNGRFPIRPGLGEYANSLMVDLGERVAFGGALAVLVADGFFFRTDAQRTRAALADLGLRVEAAISVEGGLRPQSEIPTSLLLITHGDPLDTLFVGRLDSAIDPGVLIENLSHRRPGEFMQLGLLYPTERYRGWHAVLNERELLVGLSELRTPIVELNEIAVAFVRLPADDVEASNSIYVPEFPRSQVRIEPPDKPRGYTRIDLDPERANARWVATWLNEPLGRTARLALASGATIERVRSQDLRRLLVALPSVEDQAKATSIGQELQLIAGEIANTRTGLYTGKLEVRQAHSFLDRVRGAFIDEPDAASTAPTVETWIERLPFPLASVGRMYLAVQPTREKFDHLEHFFEAYTIFMATVMFSAVQRDAQIYQETVAKIRSGGEPGRSILDRADFHTWINLGRTVAKRIRERLNADKSDEIRATLFGSLQADFVDATVAGDYWSALDAARLIRNERGHGGVEGERWLRGKLARLEASMNDLRLLAPHAFVAVDLLRPGSAEQGDDDIFTFDRAQRLMGSNMMFAEREVHSTASMRGRGLYLVPASGVAENPLQLLPLIQLREVPDTEERAVYYYNRRLRPDEGDGFRFVSYHFEGRPEEQVVDPDLATLIADLTPESAS